MRILITGGAGFMGSAMIRLLLHERSDVEIFNVDKLTYAGNLANVHDVADDPRYHFRRDDICDASAMDKIFTSFAPDVVINYAAETHVDRSIREPRSFLETEIFGTHTLLEMVKKFGVERMIQISTDEVFGSTAEGKFSETSPMEPNSPYAAAKAGADVLCRAYWKTYHTPVIVTHSCNFYGPYQFPEKIIPLFITNILEGKKVPLYGDGSHRREWIFTDDHCRAVLAIMAKGKPGEVYNIGTGNELSNKELAEQLLKLLGKDGSWIEPVANRPGHDWRYALDCSKARTELGWEPQISFSDGLAATVRWYQEHREWWGPLKAVV